MAGRYAAAGNQLAYFGFVDSLGFLTGLATSAPANGSDSAMWRLYGIQSATPGLPEGEDVTIPGDDDVVATITFAPNTTPAFTANFGVADLTRDAALQDTAVLSRAGINFGALQPQDPGYNNGTLIIQSRSVSQDDADAGLEVWSGMIFPLVVPQPLGRETFEGRAAGVDRVKFTAQKAAHFPTGETISETAGFIVGTAKASIIPFKSYNPLLMHRMTGDAGTDTLTLPKAVADVTNIFAVVDTQVLTHGAGITAVADSTLLTFSSAPAAGAKVIVVWGIVP